MIKFNLFLLLLLCLSFPVPSLGTPSPMVERHIFSPKPDETGPSYKSPLALKLEKELIFTGVIISSRGKWAIIREKGRKKGETDFRRKEGDEIKGMVIRKIGSNYLILVGKGKEIRLNLYHKGKPRPAIPAESEQSFEPADIRHSGVSPAYSESGGGTAVNRRRNLYPHEPKPSSGSEGRTGPSSQTENPFLDALSRSQAKAAPFPPVEDASFPQDELPDPFSPENPDPLLTDLPAD